MRSGKEISSGLQKAAILMVALGTDVSAEVLKHLNQDDMERISGEIARMKHVDMDAMETVLDEFQERADTSGFYAQAGVDFAREVLIQVLGPQKAQEIVGRLGTRPHSRPFDSLRAVDPSQFVQFIQGEHPQTIALVISHLPASSAATVLSALSPEVQSDVATRIATMDPTTPEVIKHVEEVIQERLFTMGAQQDVTAVGGAKALVEILNQVDRGTERTILEGLSEADPALADSIKEQMFIFEDILNLDNRTVQMILREVDQEDLRLALKGVGDNVRELIFRNISERAAETLKEDLDLMGPVRLRDVETAQQKIVGVIRRLEEAGEIVTRRDGEDEIIE